MKQGVVIQSLSVVNMWDMLDPWDEGMLVFVEK